INIGLEESSLYLAPGMTTTYFASSGYSTFSEYDIIVTRGLVDMCTHRSILASIGVAVNSERADEILRISHCGRYAVFARQISEHNSDMFEISLDQLLH